jgi:C-terminal processing protease CtpA/Prc
MAFGDATVWIDGMSLEDDPSVADDLRTGVLRPGAVVARIDGREAATLLAEREGLISGATPQWKRWLSLFKIGISPRPDAAKLVVDAESGSPVEVSVPRQKHHLASEETRPPKVHELKPGIWYVDMDRITDDDFKAALSDLERAKGLIFDLRGYPSRLSTVVLGHLTDEPVTCAQWHVPVVTQPDREGMTYDVSQWEVEPASPRLKGKAAFITDGRAISYAETYLGIVEHYRLVEIVGSPTAGTNGNVNPFRLPGGYSISWTGMKVLKHDGSRHHGFGILPAVPMARTIRGVAEGKDELLEKAMAVVSGGS